MGMNPHGSKLKILRTILWIESIPVTRGEENSPVDIKQSNISAWTVFIWELHHLQHGKTGKNHQMAEVYFGKCAQAFRCGGGGWPSKEDVSERWGGSWCEIMMSKIRLTRNWRNHGAQPKDWLDHGPIFSKLIWHALQCLRCENDPRSV